MDKKSKVMLVIIIILLLLVVLFAIMLVNYRVLFGDLKNGDVNNKVGLNNDNTIQSGTNLVLDNMVQDNNLVNDNVVIIGNSVENNVIENSINNNTVTNVIENQGTSSNQSSENSQVRDLTTIEIAEVKKFLEDKSNRNFLDVVSDFKSYEEISIETMILFADIVFASEYKLQGIEEMYHDAGGGMILTEIIRATVSDVQKIYKEKFNVDMSKEDIKNMAKNYKAVPIYYNSEHDLLMFMPDGVGGQYFNKMLSGKVQNDKYSLVVEYGTAAINVEDWTKILTLIKKDGKYYFESLVTENNIEINNVQPLKISKIDKNKDIVYSSYSKSSSEYSYSIPCININSEDAKKVNKEIETYYKPLIEEELEDEADNLSVIMNNMKYISYINDNILSLIISIGYPNDCIYYKTYNLDIYTGKIITNKDIVNLKNVTESEFLDMLKELYKKQFVIENRSKENYINDIKNSSMEYTEAQLQSQIKFYDEQLNKTISKENYSMQTSMFLNENGKLCVIAPIYSLAGAELYYRIINTNI